MELKTIVLDSNTRLLRMTTNSDGFVLSDASPHRVSGTTY